LLGRRQDRVRLRDGSQVFVRPVRRGDKDRLAAMTDALSEESRFRRYLGPKGRLSASDLRYLTEIDHRDHEALVALEHRDGPAVGVARYIRLGHDGHTAEAAVVVSDPWQRRGIGTMLLRRLSEHARENGIARFTGVVLSSNRPTLGLAAQLGESRVRHDGHGTADVETALPAGEPRDARAPGRRSGRS
jgi:GNAT superfamily N-acetyltransferase